MCRLDLSWDRAGFVVSEFLCYILFRFFLCVFSVCGVLSYVYSDVWGWVRPVLLISFIV